MALKPADMSNCDPKRKCLSGPNEGYVYTPGDECDAPATFDPALCDCTAGCSPNADGHGACLGGLSVNFGWQFSSYFRREYNWTYGEGYYKCDRYKEIFGELYCDWDYYLPVTYTENACGTGECYVEDLLVGSCNSSQNPYCEGGEPTISIRGPGYGNTQGDPEWPEYCDCDAGEGEFFEP